MLDLRFNDILLKINTCICKTCNSKIFSYLHPDFKMSNLKIVADDDEFSAILKGAGDDLVVIDFYTTWCRPCKTMEPVFEAMAIHYPKALFMKVDADKCFNTAMNYKVSGVPFFVIYFNKTVVETIQGANPQELELKIRLAEIESRKAASALEQANNTASNVNPTISTFGKLGCVTPYIDHENCHCLNDLTPSSFHNFLGGKKLISGKGTGKMLMVYSFTQKMMLQSFKIKANPSSGPKVLRFFVNHPKVLDFNVGTTLAPSQEVTLSQHDLQAERAIELRSGSFQMVTNLQIFVISGQGRSSRIEIDSMQIFGAPVLAIQPLLAAESVLAPGIAVTSVLEATNKSNQPPQAEPSTSCNKNLCKTPGSSKSCCAKKSDTLGALCTVPQPQKREIRVSQHTSRHNRTDSNTTNGNPEQQRPGNNKKAIQGNKNQPNSYATRFSGATSKSPVKVEKRRQINPHRI